MSKDLVKAFSESVTATSTTQAYPLGARRFEGGKEYVYCQANATVAVNQAVKLDITNSVAGLLVIPTAAVGDALFGVAEVAVANGSFFWCTVRGTGVSCKILTAATAGQIIAPTSTAGVLGVAANTDVTIQRAMANEAGAATNAAKNISLY